MDIILTSSISLGLLVLVIGWMFHKLENISRYNIIMYLFLGLFWIVMTFIKKQVDDEKGAAETPLWVWPLVAGSFQLTQVLVRIPFGLLSIKMQSRQMPILISTLFITAGGILMVASNFSVWSMVIASIFAGVYGSTYGLQNQYWSENVSFKSIFISVALIATLPSASSLIGTLVFESLDYTSNADSMKWVVVGFLVAIVIGQVLYYFWPERKETIHLQNLHGEQNHKIAGLRMKDLLIWSFGMMLTTFGFNMVTTGGSAGDNVSSSSSLETVILTVASIVVALFTALFLVKVVRSKILMLISKVLLIIGFVMATILAFNNDHTVYERIIFLVIATIGFSLFQTLSVGITLHCDHKNAMMFLGIWLTLRSFATGAAVTVETEIQAYEGASSFKWVALSALIISTVSFLYSMLTYKKTKNSLIFEVVDTYEYSVKNGIFHNSRKLVK